MVYERIHAACPYCGYKHEPEARSGPEFVDGDLEELSPEALAIMRGAVARVDMPIEQYRAELAAKRCPHLGQLAHVKRHAADQAAQLTLRDSIALWAGVQRHHGRPDSESYRRFYFSYGVDVLSAQALRADDAEELNERIRKGLHHVQTV